MQKTYQRVVTQRMVLDEMLSQPPAQHLLKLNLWGKVELVKGTVSEWQNES